MQPLEPPIQEFCTKIKIKLYVELSKKFGLLVRNSIPQIDVGEVLQDGVFLHQAQPADVIGGFEVIVGRQPRVLHWRISK